MRVATNVIRAEHRALAAVLHGLQYLVREVRESKREPDFRVLRAMVHYIDTFPEKLHHPKEDRYLFARIRQRCSEGNSILDQLEAQHIHGVKLIRDLEQSLLRWEMGGKEEFSVFAQEVERYSEFHWNHMRQEEEVVLPLAERVLTEQDWHEIDEAFAGNADPLIDQAVEKDFERLFTRIVNMAPPPIGLGLDQPAT
jgi:hemerythrin-like domain-containing protein